MIGRVVGNYRILESLGRGGMGEVFRAIDLMLERQVAIKVLHRHLTQDPDMLQRFRAEAVMLAKLDHPNIATLHNFFEQQGDYFMVMQYIDGETFESLLRRYGVLPLRRAIELFCQALQGFEHAHSKKIVHRDIKPSNLMLNTSGQVKVTDFGIARVLGAQRLTQSGGLVGTVEYMSPEQVQGLEIDERSDIYSLGNLLYELITGHSPFNGMSEFNIMRAHLEGRPVLPRQLIPGLPEEIEQAILVSMEKDPALRFQNVSVFRTVLERSLNSLPEEVSIITPELKQRRAASTAENFVPPTRIDPSPAYPFQGSPDQVSAFQKPFWQQPRFIIAACSVLLALAATSAIIFNRYFSPSSIAKESGVSKGVDSGNLPKPVSTNGVEKTAIAADGDLKPIIENSSNSTSGQPKQEKQEKLENEKLENEKLENQKLENQKLEKKEEIPIQISKQSEPAREGSRDEESSPIEPEREPERERVPVETRESAEVRDLMIAARRGQKKDVAAALNRGADVNVRDSVGRTALMLAAGGGHDDTVRLLLDRGASVNIRDNYGKTVLDHAARQNGIMKILLGRGAR
jgi:serine/threonine protein kinase